MKKYKLLALVLCVAVFVLSLCACDYKINLGKDDTDVNSSTTSPDASNGVSIDDVTVSPSDAADIKEQIDSFSDDEVKKNEEFFTVEKTDKPTGGISNSRVDEGNSSDNKDEDIISSKKYTVSGRIVSDGVTSYYKMAQDGKKLSVMTYYGEKPIGFIVNGLNVYIVDTEQESYIVVPKSILESADSTGKLDAVFEGELTGMEKNLTDEGTETVDGQKLSFKKYDDGTIAYYSGNALVMTKTEEGTIIYYDEISADAPASLFLPPKGYEMQQITLDLLEDMASE